MEVILFELRKRKEVRLLDIRFILPEEVSQLRRNVLTSFPSKTPQALLDAMPRELVSPDEGRYLGCFDDSGALVGSCLLMDFSINVRGKMMPMGAAAYVACNFLHKKEHVAYQMLRVFVGYYDKLDVCMGCLHPFSPAFYGKMGFGFGNESTMYSPRPSGIRSFGDKSGLAYASPADTEEILEFYRQHARNVHGATTHAFMDYHRIFDSPYVVLCRRGGRITGYLTFEFVEVDHYTDMYHDLAVHEMFYEDTQTLCQFMTFFASQSDQIERVRIYSDDPHLHMMFTNPDSGENRAYDGAIQEIGRRNMGYMTRILNVRRYFEEQPHCQSAVSRPFVLELHVADSFYPQNAGVYQLRVEGASVRLVDGQKPDVVLGADISALSSLVMGAVPLRDLIRLNLLTLSDEHYADDIQSAIGWHEKPRNSTYF